jgi:hypothetical protein
MVSVHGSALSGESTTPAGMHLASVTLYCALGLEREQREHGSGHRPVCTVRPVGHPKLFRPSLATDCRIVRLLTCTLSLAERAALLETLGKHKLPVNKILR